MTKLEVIDKLCEVIAIQADVIYKQTLIIEQSKAIDTVFGDRKRVDKMLDTLEHNLRKYRKGCV